MKSHVFTAVLTCMIIACFTVEAGPNREWTAVGDDGMSGRASGYIMALSADSALIVSASNDVNGFEPVEGLIIYGPDVLPVPAEPGTQEVFTLSGLAPGIWFASIKAFDEVPNYAALGNVFRFVIADKIAPAAIMTLQ